ncbi:MAG: hypothetical protein LBJ67_07560, partial [Planctomycetaceae bacterium]|nr:hypothetical protein [Planctomycetaceae bacterium]
MNISELSKIEGCAEKLVYLLVKLGYNTPVELCNVAGINRIVLQRILSKLLEKKIIIKYKYGHYKCNPEVTVQSAKCNPEVTVQSAKCNPEVTLPATNCAVGVSLANNNPLKEKKEKSKGDLNFKNSETPIPTNTTGKPTKQLKIHFDEGDERYEKYLEYKKSLMHFVKIDDMSPDLVERIAFGYAQQLPGFSKQQIQAIIAEAQDRKKRGKIKHLYVHISTCVAAAFNANGY